MITDYTRKTYLFLSLRGHVDTLFPLAIKGHKSFLQYYPNIKFNKVGSFFVKGMYQICSDGVVNMYEVPFFYRHKQYHYCVLQSKDDDGQERVCGCIVCDLKDVHYNKRTQFIEFNSRKLFQDIPGFLVREHHELSEEEDRDVAIYTYGMVAWAFKHKTFGRVL